MSEFSILVVDDEPDNFDVVETLLCAVDYQLHYAASGNEAIASLSTYNPDLILLDVMMPGTDGIEVCRQIKAMPQWQTVPIIMVTALSAKSDLARCLSAGADDFLSKPVSAVELRARVGSMLRIKQQYDKVQALCQVRENTIELLEATLQELRGNLASSLSHELNTPLNGILGSIKLLQNDLEDMEIDEIREILAWTDRSARRLENLTTKFLIYLELELYASRQKPLESVQSQFSVSTIQSTLKFLARNYHRSHDLIFDLEDAPVCISERYLAIICHELVENALKYSSPETVIEVRSKVEGKGLNFWVRDAGRGMSAAQIAKIGAFMQFDRQMYEQQGIGLGLKIVQKIVELAGGTFDISSDGSGTTVHLSLQSVCPSVRSVD